MSCLNLPNTNLDNVDNKIMKTQQQINEVMDLMRSNIERLSERSERLEVLAKRAEVLDMSTQQFNKCAVQIRRKKQWKAYAHKYIAVAALATTAVLGLVFFMW